MPGLPWTALVPAHCPCLVRPFTLNYPLRMINYIFTLLCDLGLGPYFSHLQEGGDGSLSLHFAGLVGGVGV